MRVEFFPLQRVSWQMRDVYFTSILAHQDGKYVRRAGTGMNLPSTSIQRSLGPPSSNKLNRKFQMDASAHRTAPFLCSY
jgi:hypothetical protein